MNITIQPGLLHGRVQAISSKSMVHRYLLAALLCKGPTRVYCNTNSNDVLATVQAIQALGAKCRRCGDYILVTPGPAPVCTVVNCGECATTARMVLPIAGAMGVDTTITGGGNLPNRPFAPLCSAMEQNGCQLTGQSLPIHTAGQLQPGVYRLPGNVSSQFISGLLFALPLLKGDSCIQLTTPLQSAGYVQMSIQVLSQFGIRIHPQQNGYLVPGNQQYISAGSYTPEGDWSNAAFWLCAGALGGPVGVTGLDPHSAQGDSVLPQLLAKFGAKVVWQGNILQVQGGRLVGCCIDVRNIPDLVPALAICAACAKGTTRFEGAGRLRIKECDRIAGIQQALQALGASVTVQGDNIVVVGSPALGGGKASAMGDHRIAMLLAVLASGCKGDSCIIGAEAVKKSDPNFFEQFTGLGGTYHVI